MYIGGVKPFLIVNLIFLYIGRAAVYILRIQAIDSSIYFAFTSLVNFLYENHSSFNKRLIKVGYKGLQNFSLVRDLFIKQAMGRINLID